MIDLKDSEIFLIKKILQEELPGTPVWVFGSRIQGQAKPHSDIDLALITSQPLPLSKRAQLSRRFSDSPLPITVDIVDWCRISEEFRGIIRKRHVKLL